MKRKGAEKIAHQALGTEPHIARMIMWQGEDLLESEGVEELNVVAMVCFQLQRLLDGKIEKCVCCSKSIPFELHIKDPLRLTCSDDCIEKAVLLAAKIQIRIIKEKLPLMEESMRKSLLMNSSSAVSSGDVVDQSTSNIDTIWRGRIKIEREKMAALNRVVIEIGDGDFSMDCAGHCSEEIPLATLLQNPLTKFCPHCQRNDPKAKRK